MSRLSKLLFVWIACLHLCGGHLGVWQIVAWTGMVVSYSQEDGFTEGVRRTFNGENPCALCKRIAQERERERKEGQQSNSLPAKVAKLLEHLASPAQERVPAALAADASFAVPVAPLLGDGLGRAGPETPPPRLAA